MYWLFVKVDEVTLDVFYFIHTSAQHIIDANAPGIDMSTGGDEELDSEGGIASMSQLLDLEERLLTPTFLSSRSQQRWILIK